jgi:hypothetical protein
LTVPRLGPASVAFLIGAALPAIAWGNDGSPSIVGTWKLVSRSVIDLGSQRTLYDYGERPTGYVVYTPGGYMALFVAADAQKPPELPRSAGDAGEAPAASPAPRTYVGTYRVDAGRLLYHIDSAWLPAWNGSDQVRFFRIEGKRLTITSEPREEPGFRSNVVSVSTFERTE